MVPFPVPLDPPVTVSHSLGGMNDKLAAEILPVSPAAPSVNLSVHVPFISVNDENVVIMLVFGIGLVASAPPEFEVLKLPLGIGLAALVTVVHQFCEAVSEKVYVPFNTLSEP